MPPDVPRPRFPGPNLISRRASGTTRGLTFSATFSTSSEVSSRRGQRGGFAGRFGPGEVEPIDQKSSGSGRTQSDSTDELYFSVLHEIAPPAKEHRWVTEISRCRPFWWTRRRRGWLRLGSSHSFLWLHLMDPHSPYYPAEDAFRELTGTSVEPGRARYVNEYWNRSDLGAPGLRSKRDEVVRLYDAGIRWVTARSRAWWEV